VISSLVGEGLSLPGRVFVVFVVFVVVVVVVVVVGGVFVFVVVVFVFVVENADDTGNEIEAPAISADGLLAITNRDRPT
jgi:hypothetical protein